MEFTRGETPANIEEKCLDLCKSYLAGVWLKQSVDTIQVKRLTGGLTNQLYYCALNNPTTGEGVPHEVAIRLYGPKLFNNEESDNERLTDLVIALIVSENKLGPKTYAIFEEGQMQSFIKHRHFRYAEQQTPRLTEELFQKLARVHSMDVPIRKNMNWLFKFFDSFYEKAYKKFPISQLAIENNLDTLKNYDIKAELDWLKETIVDIESQIVFTHIDFRGSNIMVTEPNDEIILCDFQYSSYGYRGVDFGTIMLEWNRTFDELLQAKNLVEKYPDDTQVRSLLKLYIEESEKIRGKKYSDNKCNSLEQLVKESKLFSLVAQMFLTLFFLTGDVNDEIGISKNYQMDFCEQNYKAFIGLKERFIKERAFQ